MADLNKESMAIWKSLKPMIDEEIKAQTRGSVQRRKMKVTTAPSLVTNVIGVTEPYGTEMLIPFNTNLSTANVGDVVWVEFMYGATNAFASMYASADTKDWTVGGTLDVTGNTTLGGDLSVAGDESVTGDLTVSGDTTLNGVLDVTQRRCYANLSSAGWYRVMQTKDVSGTIIDFRIGRPYYANPAEAHKISFHIVGGGKSAFFDETSDTNTLCVDKIRATYGGGLIYFDVHYNSSSLNTVFVYFDVYGYGQANGTSIAMGLASVADAPSGETVLTTHKFTDSTGVRSCAVTRVNNSYFDANAVSKLIAFSKDDTLYMRLFLNPSTSIPTNTAYFEIATVSLPSNRILAHPLYFTIPGQSTDANLLVYLTTGGSIRVANYSSVASGTTNYITTMAFPLIES